MDYIIDLVIFVLEFDLLLCKLLHAFLQALYNLLIVVSLLLDLCARGRVVVAPGGAGDTVVVENGLSKSFAVAPLNRQSILDKNGAGDAFAGAFLAQLLLGRSVEDCVHAAHWAARVVIQRSGMVLPGVCDYA